MATKKQKRVAALAKREKFMEQYLNEQINKMIEEIERLTTNS